MKTVGERNKRPDNLLNLQIPHVPKNFVGSVEKPNEYAGCLKTKAHM